ncbi:MAG: glutamine--fructose-6-phosphate transaminase (isomerizing) [Gammaproteobacteria bacterium]|nr:glutamine--fructose-6-phosphate transaminase (isomerizing) [Gammaproteobacteria bacterium]MCH9744590.1 glutamine--fructose-6-phosphate transaminase (isomerizing) [Gammaproteobacteria bacterium]
MCGIVGAIAQRDVADILLEGLNRLEYRGYDSAGIAILDPNNNHNIQRVRVLGKVAKLTEALQQTPLQGHAGIAHTRWATHGQPSEANAHPHCSHDQISVVHNGIIENHKALRKQLIEWGYTFNSETDTEVICHLIHHHLKAEKNPQKAIRKATEALHGAYALGILIRETPEKIYAIRHGGPLVIGIGTGEHFIASDQIALLPVTQHFIFLEEGDIAELDINSVNIIGKDDKPIKRKVHKSKQNANAINKGEFRHFMLKEIYDQPRALSDTLEGHIINDKLVEQAFGHKAHNTFKDIKRVLIVACGTSYHAGVVARHWIESIAGLPCQVEVASENRYRDAVIESDTLFITISQSGETADTLAALKRAKAAGFSASLAICNIAESTLARESDLVFMTRAGTEIGVAATKTFTAQLTGLLLLAIVLGQQHQNLKTENEALIAQLQQLPSIAKEILKLDKDIEKIAKRFADKQHALFLGRGEHHAIAMEGALKLKEISYMHAEAYPAGELKHGPLALVDKEMPVIVIAPHNQLFEKLASNIKEVQARGGELYIISENTHEWDDKDNVTLIPMPEVSECISPVAYTIPLQLLAYHIAVEKGTDVDQPRNLAKSVTVE